MYTIYLCINKKNIQCTFGITVIMYQNGKLENMVMKRLVKCQQKYVGMQFGFAFTLVFGLLTWFDYKCWDDLT